MVTKLSLDVYNEIYSKVPRLAVELLIKNQDGVLWVKRNISPGRGLWYIPGGTVLLDESIDDALKRVAREELGVEIEIIKFVKVIDWYKSKNVTGHPISLVYEVRIIDGEIKLDNQSSEYKYFKDLPENSMDAYSDLPLK